MRGRLMRVGEASGAGSSGPLARYEAKRDFTRSPEPRGRVAAGAAPAPRFVVQRHAARRRHFDLRLELCGVLRSWAVTRGPSLDPADKRLAVEVEDHPLDYASFEGVIEEGYGAGVVMLWDSGTWEPSPETPDAAAALAAGNLKFTLHGTRLRGGWDLVRMKPRPSERQPQWLLLKRRDAEARPREGDRLVDEATTSVLTGRTEEAIRAGKPAVAVRNTQPQGAPAARRHGARVATASGLPAAGFITPMLPTLVDRAPNGAGWTHEPKLDGYRLQAVVRGGAARLLTRNGHDWTDRFPQTAAALGRLPDCTLDGELVAPDADGSPDFAALQDAIESGTTGGLLYYAFDLLSLGDQDLRTLPLTARKARLATWWSAMARGRAAASHSCSARGGRAVSSTSAASAPALARARRRH